MTTAEVIDTFCKLDGSVIWTCTLNQTNIKNNNNKFYIMQLIKESGSGDHKVYTRYGRVGYDGSYGVRYTGSLAGAKTNFNKQFKSKTGNVWNPPDNPSFKKIPGKYFLCAMETPQVTVKTVSIPASVTKINIKPEILDLIKFLSNKKTLTKTMRTLNIDTKRMPLGKISKKQLDLAREILNDINDNISTYSPEKLEDRSSDFYTLIPYSDRKSVV